MNVERDLNDEAAILRRRIAELERELATARAALQRWESDAPSPTTDAHAEARSAASVDAGSSRAAKVELFPSRFVGRDDMYATRWVSGRTGKPGWSPSYRVRRVRRRLSGAGCPSAAVAPDRKPPDRQGSRLATTTGASREKCHAVVDDALG
ncbi:TOTE conflict system archaeo-eukaryotic primase domain-containing protein [Microbacterium sp.]|uniref:TOTE conflict system archaeo-eukaryotic primase domain-containing protein n=1 Tax=Microbacterium sp. TaxID=51671 RepID=UPI003C725A2C